MFAGVDDVLEIGSGSGRHAVWFSAALPHLAWRTSEMMLEEDIVMPSNDRTLVWRKAPDRTPVAASGRLRMYDPVAPAKRRRAQSLTGARSTAGRKPLHEPSRR